MSTEETYRLHPGVEKHYLHYYRNVFNYDDVFDLAAFSDLDNEEKKFFLWNRIYDILIEASNKANLKALGVAAEYAYQKGLENKLDPDFRVVQENVILNGINLLAAVWITFDDLNMNSKFTLEKNSVIIYEKSIDSTILGVGYFLVMYKKIEVVGDVIIIKGRKDVDYLPLKINIGDGISKLLLKN